MDATATVVTIRKGREADLAAILRIYNDEILTGTATWDEAPWTMERRRAWFAEHDELTPVLIAETPEGEVAGFAYLSRMSEKSGWRFAREDTIYLDSAYRGRGVGRILLQALLDEARRIGLRLIVASITSENAPSIALHRRCGFEVVGTLRNAGFKFGRWMSTTYMQLDLGEPAQAAPLNAGSKR
jgi:phosphinothricin acetyltransferase